MQRKDCVKLTQNKLSKFPMCLFDTCFPFLFFGILCMKYVFLLLGVEYILFYFLFFFNSLTLRNIVIFLYFWHENCYLISVSLFIGAEI